MGIVRSENENKPPVLWKSRLFLDFPRQIGQFRLISKFRTKFRRHRGIAEGLLKCLFIPASVFFFSTIFTHLGLPGQRSCLVSIPLFKITQFSTTWTCDNGQLILTLTYQAPHRTTFSYTQRVSCRELQDKIWLLAPVLPMDSGNKGKTSILGQIHVVGYPDTPRTVHRLCFFICLVSESCFKLSPPPYAPMLQRK